MSTPRKHPRLGRPDATSHAEIEQAAFRLFADRGFDATTMEAIAQEVGVGRRTLFRYFESKNDIPWGQFDDTLASFRQILADSPTEMPLHQAVHLGVLAFNDFDENAQPSHRDRMRLILQTPTLQAHSVLRYGQWRAVISEYVAERLHLNTNDLLPQTIGHISLALALTAYEAWLQDPRGSLPALLDQSMSVLRTYLAD